MENRAGNEGLLRFVAEEVADLPNLSSVQGPLEGARVPFDRRHEPLDVVGIFSPLPTNDLTPPTVKARDEVSLLEQILNGIAHEIEFRRLLT